MEKVSTVQIQNHLDGLEYPAGRDKIKNHAKVRGAKQEVLDFIDKLPDRDYSSPVDVSKEVGKINNGQ